MARPDPPPYPPPQGESRTGKDTPWTPDAPPPPRSRMVSCLALSARSPPDFPARPRESDGPSHAYHPPARIAHPARRAGHDRNPVLRAAIDEGLSVGGASVKLPAPTFRDGQSADDQRTALRRGGRVGPRRPRRCSSRRSRPRTGSGSATPRPRGRPSARATSSSSSAASTSTRSAPTRRSGRPAAARSRPANMRFEARVLTPDELKGTPASSPAEGEWFTHADRPPPRPDRRRVDRPGRRLEVGRLARLRREDRPALRPRREVPQPLVDHRAEGDRRRPRPAAAVRGRDRLRQDHPPGGAARRPWSSRSTSPSPSRRAWFGGEPILRSKFGLIAQDQVRRLRRELQKSR